MTSICPWIKTMRKNSLWQDVSQMCTPVTQRQICMRNSPLISVFILLMAAAQRESTVSTIIIRRFWVSVKQLIKQKTSLVVLVSHLIEMIVKELVHSCMKLRFWRFKISEFRKEMIRLHKCMKSYEGIFQSGEWLRMCICRWGKDRLLSGISIGVWLSLQKKPCNDNHWILRRS